MIGILDIDIGNLRSVSNAVYTSGFDFRIIRKPHEFNDITHLILPGVGAFSTAVNTLSERQLITPIHDFTKSGRPLLGICLGMEILGSRGFEGGESEGLGLVSGQVRRFSENLQLSIPHVGWNSVNFVIPHPVFQGVKSGMDFYFVHSYHFICSSEADTYGVTEYGDNFSSIIGRNNVIGLQFHPEKSQANGVRLIENFCNWDGQC